MRSKVVNHNERESESVGGCVCKNTPISFPSSCAFTNTATRRFIFVFIRVHSWLKKNENQTRYQKPFRHHHGQRTRRTFLARQPGEDAEAVAPIARQQIVPPA